MRFSRRRLLTLLGAASAGFLGGSPVRGRTGAAIRVGAVLPMSTGGVPRLADSDRLAGDAANKGAILAEEHRELFDPTGEWRLELLVSNAPDAESALRAARRMTGLEEVAALLGGFGNDQASALSTAAAESGTLFFNIGSPTQELRRRGKPDELTFHVEASAGRYLSALVETFPAPGFRRWFLIHRDDEEGSALAGLARGAIEKHGSGAEVVVEAIADRAAYPEVLEAVHRTGPDVVLPLLDWRSQLDFIGHYEAAAPPSALAGFPYPVTQTRAFLASLARAAPRAGAGKRVALWDATLPDRAAAELNRAFLSRWGVPMDPSSWAAYAAVKILVEAVTRTGSVAGQELAHHLLGGDTAFDVGKGENAFFRPCDHELSQPIYLIATRTDATELVDLASVIDRFPAAGGCGPE